jgi:hypothetical protein
MNEYVRVLHKGKCSWQIAKDIQKETQRSLDIKDEVMNTTDVLCILKMLLVLRMWTFINIYDRLNYVKF